MITEKLTQGSKLDMYKDISNIIDSLRDKRNIEHIKSSLDVISHLVKKGVLSYGNRKLSKNVAIFNLMPVATCPICKDCKDTCYALKAIRAYPTCFDKRMMLTWLALNDLPLLKSLICKELDKIVNGKAHRSVKFVRIHESGDFFSQAYINIWTEIIALYPSLRFYFYTKTDSLFDFSEMFSLNNQKNERIVNMVKSILPNGMINFGDIKYLNYILQIFPSFHVCPYGFCDRNGNKIIPHCGKCTICMENEFVLFLDHYIDSKTKVYLSELIRKAMAA